MRILRDSLMTLVTLGAIFVLGVVSSVLTAHYLGPEGKGVFTLVFLLPALCASLGSLGIGSANVYLVRRSEVAMGDLLSNSIAVALGVAMLASAGIFFAWPWLGTKVLGGISPLLVALGLVTLPFALLTDYFLSILLGYQKVGRFNAASFVSKVFTLGGLAVALVVLGAGVPGAVMATMLGAVLTLALVIYEIRRVQGKELRIPRPNLKALRRSFNYGIREHLGNIAMFFSYRIDMFFVAALAGVSHVGIYAIAVMMAELLFYLPNAVSTVLFPHLAGRERSEGAIQVARSARVVAAAVLAGALISIPLASPVVRLAFPEAFLPAVPAFYLLLPGVCALSVSKILSRYFTGTLGRPLISAGAHWISLAVNLPLNVFLIPTYGIVGAAAATSAAYIAHMIVSLFLFRRHSGLSLAVVLLPRRNDLGWISSRVLGTHPELLGKSHA
jgi:O-antigen/teichoic acid export membrane protein